MVEEPTTAPPAKPEPPPAPAAPPEPAEDWETRFKYLLADFENYRKRTAREHERQRERARGELLRSLLPLHEAIERARASVRRAPDSDPVRAGLELLWKEWSAFFDGQGVAPLAKPGDPFESEEHEAVAEAPVSPDHPEGTIVEVVQQGYSYSGGLLRPAKVVVARRAKPARASEVTPSPAEPETKTTN